MIHSSGVYAFESKNYSGWIFGTEDRKTWTQTLPIGRKSQKEHFLNPIMQNKLHIKWLMNQIGNEMPIHSIIVFSERCTLKDLTVTSPDNFVIKRDDIRKIVRIIIEKTGSVISEEKQKEVYEKLYQYTQVSEAVKGQHVQDIINEKDTVLEEVCSVDNSEDSGICPKCKYVKNI